MLPSSKLMVLMSCLFVLELGISVANPFADRPFIAWVSLRCLSVSTISCPLPPKPGFEVLSVGGFFRWLWGWARPQEVTPTGCLRGSASWLRRGGSLVG